MFKKHTICAFIYGSDDDDDDDDDDCVEGIEKEEVMEVCMGNVYQASLGQNPARQAALFAGKPVCHFSFAIFH